jgi:3-oxoacyl-[acyl-carrier protein] reductase
MIPRDSPLAVVTGGGRGIGKAISLRLARAGYDIAVNYRKNESSADQTVDTIQSQGQRAVAYRASIDDWDEDVTMVESIIEDFGRVDVLIHNGGVASPAASVIELDHQSMERVIRTNAFGSFYLSKLLIPHLRQQENSSVIFISTVATANNPGQGSAYNMGKAASEALAHTLAREEQPNGIRVNIVAPGLVVTDMGDKLAKAMTRGAAEGAADLDATSPFGRVCRPEDVAEVVAFLVSSGGSYVSNQWLAVDGGRSSSRN